MGIHRDPHAAEATAEEHKGPMNDASAFSRTRVHVQRGRWRLLSRRGAETCGARRASLPTTASAALPCRRRPDDQLPKRLVECMSVSSDVAACARPGLP